jgi:hypothetical protein
VSLVTDIVQLFGTSSVPVVVAGTVLGVFELGERFASQRAKDALSKWLLTFDVRKAKSLPDGTLELFERIFGERHFSLKCFVRSAAFSLSAMAFIAILFILIDPNFAFVLKDILFKGNSFLPYGEWPALLLWLPWSILIDYMSLFKTRFILRVLIRMRQKNNLVLSAILGIDFLVYKLIFVIGFTILSTALIDAITLGDWPSLDADTIILETPIEMFNLHTAAGTFSIYFWAGFAPSIWMWLYILALFVTRGLLRSEKLVNWLRWGLDVEKNPFRSIGAVAAALAFIVSVAILLVSAEVSRITTTSNDESF